MSVILPCSDGSVKGPIRPVALAFEPDGIPEELRAIRRWVAWRYQWEEGQAGAAGRWRKPPFSPRTGRAASVTNPDTWGSFEEACAARLLMERDGIGLVLDGGRDLQHGVPLCCLDIDGCRDPLSGSVSDEAVRVAERLASWTEISPSGTGLHVWFFADLPSAGRRQGKWEIYCAGRFICVTGRLYGAFAPIIRHRQADADWLLATHFASDKTPLGKIAAAHRPILADEEVLSRCGRGPGSTIFGQLVGGLDPVNGNASESDLSFCARLAFYCAEESQIVRLWKATPRWRDKCDRPLSADDPTTYAEATARKALATAGRYYDPGFRTGRPAKRTEATPEVAPVPPPPVLVTPTPTPQVEENSNRRVRRISDIRRRETTWYLDGWIPRGELSLVVGQPGSGKSTFAAYLVSLAKTAIILPGFEESIDGQLAGRLAAMCPNLDNVYALEGGAWTMPSAAVALAAKVKELGADLVLADPVDSYLDEGVSENDGKAVRSCLEGLVRVATSTGAAVIAIRHPGRDPQNICPGSRSWRAVPRMVVELIVDAANPDKRFMHLYKDSMGATSADTYYLLPRVGPRQPCRFVMGGAVRRADGDISRRVTDTGERRLLDEACDMIKKLLADGEQEGAYIVKAISATGIGTTTIHNASHLLGVIKNAVGTGRGMQSMWKAPKEWPKVGT